MLIFNLKAFSDIFHSLSTSSLIVLRKKLVGFCQQYIWKIAHQILVHSLRAMVLQSFAPPQETILDAQHVYLNFFDSS